MASDVPNVSAHHTRKSIPAEPKDKWYLLSGLNLTQHTLALASKQATECSMSVDHNLTEKEKK